MKNYIKVFCVYRVHRATVLSVKMLAKKIKTYLFVLLFLFGIFNVAMSCGK